MTDVFDLENEVPKEKPIFIDQPEKPERSMDQLFKHYNDSELQNEWIIYRNEMSRASSKYYLYEALKNEFILRDIMPRHMTEWI